MRTIEYLIEYPLTPHERHHLREAWIINGIGGEWENIEEDLMKGIKLIPWFDKNKAESLLCDIRELSVDHDIQYFFKLGFRKANYKFAKKLFFLLKWSPISGFFKRLAIALMAYIILQRLGKKHYYKIW
jgi:hypothetical protein